MANSVITVTEGDATREVAIEGYTCTIDSGSPENMSVSRYFQTEEARQLYRENRETCREDYDAFQRMCYALQDKMFASDAVE